MVGVWCGVLVTKVSAEEAFAIIQLELANPPGKQPLRQQHPQHATESPPIPPTPPRPQAPRNCAVLPAVPQSQLRALYMRHQ